MRLASVRIRHYKSLSDIEFQDMQPLTVLVGCNGVGKSNIIDALRFLRDAVTEGLDHAVSKRGGIALIRQYSPTKPYRISFDFTFEQGEGISSVTSRYSLSLTSLREGNFRIEHESCEWFQDIHLDNSEENEPDSEFRRLNFQRDANGKLRIDGVDEHRTLTPDTLALGGRVVISGYIYRLATPLVTFISGFRFSSIYPNTLRTPAHPDTDATLKESGENWASIIRTMRKTSRGKQALEQIKEMMGIVMPQLEDITTRAIGSFVLPHFKVREKNGDAHFFDPSQISDGTLRILGILLALYHTPHPSLMVIEEPEQTVNPALLALLSDAFHEASERTQLLITSHSPHLVDLFDPEKIRVVTMQNGETQVSPIRRSQREAVKEHLLSLEQIMSSEGLLPEDA